MKSAICYLTWNRFEYTKLSLVSILKNTDRSKYELILWDNGSSDEGMIDWLRQICVENKFSYLFFKRNEGLTRAMNNQMRIMDKIDKFDVFCHIANDIIVPENWLEAVFEAIKNEKVGNVGLNLEEDFNFEIEDFGNIRLEKIRENGNVGGAHFCIPKRIYDLIGDFQQVKFGYGQQDANMSLEIKILPIDVWCYYLPIKQYHGNDLSKTMKTYNEYQVTIEGRLRRSGSDSSGGRNYRANLLNLRKQYDNKIISAEQLIEKIKLGKIFVELDKSQLLETNLK